jgi:hypothetical protein
MRDAEVTTVGLSEEADDLLDQMKEQDIFAEKLDGYRFAISFAAASGVIPPEIAKRKTLFNVGSLDPGQLIRSAVEALYEDEVNTTSPYRIAERLADWGVRELHEQASHGRLDLAAILKNVEDVAAE